MCTRLHELILKIWLREVMPEEWELGVICPVYKKGDKLECSNHRRINLLNTACKIFADILRQHLLVFSERSTGEYQGGFRTDRSTTDQLFSFRQIMETETGGRTGGAILQYCS